MKTIFSNRNTTETLKRELLHEIMKQLEQLEISKVKASRFVLLTNDAQAKQLIIDFNSNSFFVGKDLIPIKELGGQLYFKQHTIRELNSDDNFQRVC
ncbi:hypothetical protein ACNI3T_05385 [Christiangramia sp. ASW11-125]|uniref:hypothetical protein n=1 Tax=Christiangramia sp. ASW11-125 TaxID=3400701 RepID=UPI003AAC2C77